MTECQVWVVRYCVWNLVLILFTVDVIFSIVEPIPANPGYKKYGCNKVKICVHLIWFNKSHVLLCIGWSMVEKHYYFCKHSLRQLNKISELQKFQNFHMTCDIPFMSQAIDFYGENNPKHCEMASNLTLIFIFR